MYLFSDVCRIIEWESHICGDALVQDVCSNMLDCSQFAKYATHVKQDFLYGIHLSTVPKYARTLCDPQTARWNVWGCHNDKRELEVGI